MYGTRLSLPTCLLIVVLAMILLSAAETYGGAVPSQGGANCLNLQCKQVTCATGTTSISGTVYDPAGLRPLPNVKVYVPNGAVAAITSGATCDGCTWGLSGLPLVQTTTDTRGKFRLNNMPVGTNIPVVIQVGKWRRQITVHTTKCADTALPAGLTRLPRNKTEGDIPKIALVTGGADALECLLRKIGIADSEFTNPTGTGRVHLFKGVNGTSKYSAALGGAAFPSATQLWNALDPNMSVSPPIYGLKAYDVVLLGCEGNEFALTDSLSNKSVAALQAMQDYANAGGRVLAIHYQYTWMKRATAANGFPAAYRTWGSMVSWNSFANLPSPSAQTVLRTFPKAMALSDWLKVTPSPTAPWATGSTPSSFSVYGGRHTINTINNTNILKWAQTVTGSYPQYFTFDTPVGAASGACGRFAFTDIHATSGHTVNAPNGFPTACTTTTMSAQEGVLEFMFFDIASPVCGGTTPP